MLLQPALAFLIIRGLFRCIQNEPGSAWRKIFTAANIVAILLMTVPVLLHTIDGFFLWFSHAFILSLIFLVFYKKEFRPVKQLVYALLPLLLIDFFSDVAELISPSFYKEWHRSFNLAAVFALVWMGAMLIINNRQKKALERERLKTEAIEKERLASEQIKTLLEVQVKERTAALESQKDELEKTLEELKQAQNQLVQSEKMASLGELTAGIAHEIQNPLNFVNNFSELNRELLAEMNDEIEKGNFDEVRSIAQNIITNEEKITQHGKRADGIVKGMLQHSRNSNGQKEAVNINILADEYLRLAYHGLRAKDKSFNAAMKTAFDDSVGSININPQDIGRVILNLITNAFYAVAEKKKQQPDGYEPTVTVSTKKLNGKVQVTVADNGNGIPPNVLDKIFQPFFTTKPAGQGTGLGLSMSYDIITRGHGGELNVENTEGKGATFIIQLPA